MSHGDITAAEVYADREMLNRLGYGIFDVSFGSFGGVGFENVKDFSYVIAQDQDDKLYRQKVYELTGHYYPNRLAKAIWDKFIDHKWVLSERAGHEVDLPTAAQDWMEKYSHDFLKDWTFHQPEVPQRFRYQNEPRKGVVGLMAGALIPHWRELLDAGFTITDIARAALVEAALPGTWRKAGLTKRVSQRLHFAPRSRRRKDQEPAKKEKRSEPLYLKVKKLLPIELADDQYFVRMVANMTGHEPATPEEAQQIWHEILEHKSYMSQEAGADVGLHSAALDYFRRLNLLQQTESTSEDA